MKISDIINEGPRDDIAAFSAAHNDPMINTRVQSQAARKNPAWKKTLTGLMARYGFALVGAGVNGAVYQHPNYDYVLKVYRGDGGYDEWLHFARTHLGNPYVPVTRGGIIQLNSVFKAVRLEVLKPCPLGPANTLCFKIDGLTDHFDKIVAMREEDRALADVALFMRDWGPVSDLTHHNVMQRKNGEPVIVDPLYWEPGTDLDF